MNFVDKIKFFNKSQFYRLGDYIAFKNLLKKENDNGLVEGNN